MEAEVFLDTAYAIALSAQLDEFHVVADKLSRQIEVRRPWLITTRCVLQEIGNALSKRRYRNAGVTILSWHETDPALIYRSVCEGI